MPIPTLCQPSINLRQEAGEQRTITVTNPQTALAPDSVQVRWFVGQMAAQEGER